MVAEKRMVRIGREAFVLSPDGDVVRTMVAKIDKDGRYQFLNGDGDHRLHWFSFERAVLAASDRIGDQQEALRKELRALTLRSRALETQGYRDGVMNASYRVVDLREKTFFMKLRRARELKKVHVPERYLTPGSVVYTIIKPTTHAEPEGYGYRPYKYFILETEVTSVCFSPDGEAHYTFSTPFVVEEFFLSRMDATTKLEGSGLEPCIHFVSSKQENEELEKVIDDVPF